MSPVHDTPSENGRKKRILLFEGGAPSYEACTVALEREGFEVSKVADLARLLESLHERSSDAVVIDAHGRNLDQLKEILRAIATWSDLPVIIVCRKFAEDKELSIASSRPHSSNHLVVTGTVEELVTACTKATEGGLRRRFKNEQLPDKGCDVLVLVVDTEKEYRDKIARELEKWQMRVTCVDSGTAVMKEMSERKFSFVVMDYDLPDVSGMDLVKWIKTKSPETEIVLLTKRPDVLVAIRGVKLGILDYFVKPQHEESLARTLRRCCQKKSAVS